MILTTEQSRLIRETVRSNRAARLKEKTARPALQKIAKDAAGGQQSSYSSGLQAFIDDAESFAAYKESLPKNKRYLLEKSAAGFYTLQEWQDLCAKYDHRCLCCGRTDRPLTVDHVVPLFHGGNHRIDNLQPLCRNCNSSKGTKRTDYRPKIAIKY